METFLYLTYNGTINFAAAAIVFAFAISTYRLGNKSGALLSAVLGLGNIALGVINYLT